MAGRLQGRWSSMTAWAAYVAFLAAPGGGAFGVCVATGLNHLRQGTSGICHNQVNLFQHEIVRSPVGAQTGDMIMKDFLKVTIVTGYAVTMLVLNSISASAGFLDHTHTGYGQNLTVSAQAQAVANWNAQVAAHDGAQFATMTYSNFSLRGGTCKVYDASLKLFSCTIVAKPYGPTTFDLKKAAKLPVFIIKP